MKIINLTSVKKAYFTGLDPLEMLEEAQDKTDFCLGAAEETGEGDTATGLIICSQYGSEVVIRWLYVEPSERGKGFGEALLSKVWDVAARAGCRYLCAYLPRRYGWDYVCPEGESFLRNQGFDKCFAGSEDGGKLFVLDMEDEAGSLPMSNEFAEAFESDMPADTAHRLEKLLIRLESEEPLRIDAGAAQLADSEPSSKERVSLTELTLPRLGRCIEKYLEEHPKDAPENAYEFPPTWFDLEKSTCVIEDGEATDLKIKKPGK